MHDTILIKRANKTYASYWSLMFKFEGIKKTLKGTVYFEVSISRFNRFMIGYDFGNDDVLEVIDCVNDVPGSSGISAIFVYLVAK